MYFGACSFLGISKLKAPRVTNMPHKNPKKRSMVGTITWETKKGRPKPLHIMTLKFNPS
jgi:hypothetical protein